MFNLIINNGTTFCTHSWSFITREVSSNYIHNVRNLSENTIMFPVNRLFCIVARQEARGGGQWRVEWTEFEMYEYFVRLKHVRLTLYLFSLLDLDNPVPSTSRLIADSMLTFDFSIGEIEWSERPRIDHFSPTFFRLCASIADKKRRNSWETTITDKERLYAIRRRKESATSVFITTGNVNYRNISRILLSSFFSILSVSQNPVSYCIIYIVFLDMVIFLLFYIILFFYVGIQFLFILKCLY